MQTEKQIKRWMLENHKRFIDRRTGELDCTTMVEVWDIENDQLGETLDSTHIAWDIAVEVELSL